MANVTIGTLGTDAIANLWANRIIQGKKEFKDVPAKLKPQVAEILIKKGYGDLVTEEF